MDNSLSKRNALREKAEKLLEQKQSLDQTKYNASLEELIHELQIYQVELEHQNNELNRITYELELSKHTYLDLYENAPFAFITINENDIIVRANSAFPFMVGKKSGFILGKSISAFICPESQDELYFFLNDIKNNLKKSFTAQVNFKSADEKVFCKIKGYSYTADEKLFIHIAITDISKEKEFENLLLGEKAIWEKTFAHISDGVFILDDKYDVIQANEAFAHILDKPLHQIIGSKSYDLLHGKKMLNHSCPSCDAIAYRNFVQHEYYETYLNKILFVVAKPVNDSNGDFLFSVLTVQDVTQKRLNEQRLKQLENIINRSPAIAFRWINKKGWPVDYVSANVESVLGYSQDDFIINRMPFINLVHPDDLERISMEVAKHSKDIACDGFIHQPYRLITKDKRMIWVEDRTFIIRENHVPVNYEGILLDITPVIKGRLELEVSRKKYKTLFDHMRDGIVVASHNNYFKDCNTTFEEMLGYSLEELKTKTIADITSPNYYDNEFIERVRHQLQTNGFTELYEKELIRKDGSTFPVELRVYRIIFENDQWEHWAVVRDITERKANEIELQRRTNEYMMLNEEHAAQNEQLRAAFDELKLLNEKIKESEENYRLLADNASDIIVLTDSKGKILYISPSIKSLIGISQKKMVASNILRYVMKFDLEKILPKLKRMRIGETIKTEYRIIKSKKEFVWVESIIKLIERDHRRLVLISSRNIHSQKKAETELINSRKLLSKTQQLAKIGGWEMDVKSGMMQWTAETYAIFEVNPSQFKPSYQALLDLFCSENKIIYEHNIKKCIRQHLPFTIEMNVATGEKNKVWIKCVGQPIIENNDVVVINGIIQDITESKQSEQLRNDIKVAENTAIIKQQLLANISHEMRTPMNGIIGMADFLFETPLNPQQIDFVNTIRDSSESLQSIINDVLDLSKIEQGKMTLSNYVFDLHELIRNAINTFKVQAQKKEIQMVHQISNDIPQFIYLDKNRLRQVINNLLSNALKYTKAGWVKLTITAEEKTDERIKARIEIEDTGIGISKENQKRVFESFTRIEDSYTKTTEGTGLGLAISKRIVELFGGEIGLESQLGAGSKFWFTFNAGIQTGNNFAKISEPKAIPDIKSKNLNILLAEDMFVNQKVITLMLENENCKVVIANNGYEVLERYTESRFDIILMDIMMPQMDGITAMQMLRQNYTNLPPIIGLSAHAMEGDAQKFLELGLDDYIEKPVKKERLITKIAQWLEKNTMD